MVPLSHEPQADLTGKPVLILSGARDPIIPVANAEGWLPCSNKPVLPSSTDPTSRA